MVSEKLFKCFTIVRQWGLMTPSEPQGGPFFTPGALLAGFMQGTTKHCYMLNTQALALLVLEKIVSHCKPVADIDASRGVVNLPPRDMVGRIYEGDYQTLLPTNL